MLEQVHIKVSSAFDTRFCKPIEVRSSAQCEEHNCMALSLVFSFAPKRTLLSFSTHVSVYLRKQGL